MNKLILVGCDLHDKTMLLKIAVGQAAPVKRSFTNDVGGRQAMIADLKKRGKEAGAEKIIVAYEAAGLGFGLYDELEEKEITCHVLAPSKMARSPKHLRGKTDEKDAEHILEILRGHYLAGNKLPAVWIPDQQIRDDRELVRARLDAQDKCTGVKVQAQALLKRHGVKRPAGTGSSWTKEYRAWLGALSECDEPLGYGARQNLSSLLRQIENLEKEIETLDKEIEKLSRTKGYTQNVKKLGKLKGVGVLGAMVFLTEMGDLSRFKNRKQIGAFLGLVPSSDESGETNDKKGHITRQGSPRLRYMLCQMVWNRVRYDLKEKAVYERIAVKNPKHKKIAVVAAMRRLAIQMWHVARPLKAAG
jgi:transposase